MVRSIFAGIENQRFFAIKSDKLRKQNTFFHIKPLHLHGLFGDFLGQPSIRNGFFWAN